MTREDDANTGALLLDALKGAAIQRPDESRLEQMLELAGRHGLIALVYEAFKARGILLESWREIVEDLALNSQVQLKAATELTRAFAGAGVNAVFAKGIALALSVYERPALRPFVDLDVLIEPESLKRADAVLRETGYLIVPKSLNNPIECSYRREKLPGFPVEIDLHWSYTGADGLQAPVRISIGKILERARMIHGVRVPDISDTVILAAGNMPRKAAQPAMLIVDFERMTRCEMDWKTIGAEAKSCHVSVGLWLGLELARDKLYAKVDAEFLRSIEPRRVRRDWLLKSLGNELLWDSTRHKQKRYSFWFKLYALDSAADEREALAALPKGMLRKLKLTKTHSQKELL